jgi:D-aminopeptidase
MMRDIDIATEASFEAGATEVIVCDTHGYLTTGVLHCNGVARSTFRLAP